MKPILIPWQGANWFAGTSEQFSQVDEKHTIMSITLTIAQNNLTVCHFQSSDR